MNIWLCWSHIWWLTLFLKLVCGNSICIMEFNLYCMTFENACNRAYFTLCLIYFKSLIYNNVNSWGQGEHFLFICVLWMLLCVYIKLIELNYWKIPKIPFMVSFCFPAPWNTLAYYCVLICVKLLWSPQAQLSALLHILGTLSVSQTFATKCSL